MQLITTLLLVTIRAGTSLLYATLGEVYTERSGILNLGVERMMMMGALTAFAVVYRTVNLLFGVLLQPCLSVAVWLCSMPFFLYPCGQIK